jgi:CheY-like chemotaxis protein
MTIRVLVVDDHPVFRAGMVAILDDLDEVEVVAQAADGEQAIDAVARHRPDVVLMDLRMPGLGGLEATARITVHHPNTAVVVLTMDSDHNSVFANERSCTSCARAGQHCHRPPPRTHRKERPQPGQRHSDQAPRPQPSRSGSTRSQRRPRRRIVRPTHDSPQPT